MSQRNETGPKQTRAQRRAEALRRNLQRRKLQARSRAAAGGGDRAAVDEGPAKETEKQDR